MENNTELGKQPQEPQQVGDYQDDNVITDNQAKHEDGQSASSAPDLQVQDNSSQAKQEENADEGAKRRKNITAQEIREEIAKMEREGVPVGPVALRNRIGGSPHTIKKLLDEYFEEKAARAAQFKAYGIEQSRLEMIAKQLVHEAIQSNIRIVEVEREHKEDLINALIAQRKAEIKDRDEENAKLKKELEFAQTHQLESEKKMHKYAEESLERITEISNLKSDIAALKAENKALKDQNKSNELTIRALSDALTKLGGTEDKGN